MSVQTGMSSVNVSILHQCIKFPTVVNKAKSYKDHIALLP